MVGVHSDFFVLNDEEFTRVLPGWKKPAPPLDVERELIGKNPFTGEDMVIRTRANPNQPVADDDAVLAPELDDVDGVVSWKWVTQFELAELSAAAGVASSVDAGMELVAYASLIGPAEAYGAVYELPGELVAALGRCTERDVEGIAQRWQELRGTDAYPPWSAEDLADLVAELTVLARKATDSGRRMYLHCGEP